MAADRLSSAGAVVVTGASSGIGEACALHLDRLGFRVFATARSARTGEALRQQASERLTVVEMDVTEPTTIAAAAETITAALGTAGLTGLVNNAGVVISGPLEFLPLDALRRQLEVNVIGQIAVTQAFLPLLRQGHGRIVMMGSVASQLMFPFTSPYAASKAALQALTAALRVELRPWDIPVSIVVPGTIATPLWGRSIERLDEITSMLPPEALRQYGRAMAAVREFGATISKLGSPPDVVAAAVAHALTANRPRTRYVVGRHSRLAGLLGRLPRRTFDGMISHLMRLPGRIS